jgi:hypothetical protein
MRRRGVCPAVWLAMTIIFWQPGAAAAGDSAFPPEVKPMLEHLAIVSEMMRTCGHVRPDLTAQLHDAWAAWQERNARVAETLEALRQDAAGARSLKQVPARSPIAIPPAKAAEFVMAYNALKQTLRHQVEDQMRTGNMKFVRNCDEVLAQFWSGHFDYHSPKD